ncbi:MAG: hypothetical protein RLY86_337 [Pseudomonadota bacterium]|jgi:Cu-Zn family superoxide dismutase
MRTMVPPHTVAFILASILAYTLIAGPAPAQQAASPAAPISVPLRSADGQDVGTVTLTPTPHGLLLRGELEGLPAGWKAIHLHEAGACTPDFKAAGGHWNPSGHSHGVAQAAGSHAGDLPNFWVSGDGVAKFEMLTGRAGFGPAEANPPGVHDRDGTAIVVHARADDHRSDPAGDSGDRIACGVIPKG